MKIEIRKSTPSYAIPSIWDSIELAMGFMYARYGNIFNDVRFIFQPSATRSRYFSNQGDPILPPTVTISVRPKLYLYEKKTLGKYRNGINVGYTYQMTCALIHELTHHVQYIEKRASGELETTKNELDFISRTEYAKLVIIC